MKSMEDYINEVYEKYEESERKHEVYKKVKVKYHNPLTTLCGVAACVLFLCVGIFSVNKFNKETEIKYATEDVQKNGEVYYTRYLYIDDTFNSRLSNLLEESSDIVIASKISIDSVGYDIVNGRFRLKTMGKIEVGHNLKGKQKKSLSYTKLGGCLSLLDLQKDKNFDWYNWEQINLSKTIPEEEKATTYFRQIPTKGCEIEDGKQYLVFMQYDEENDIYNIFDIAYGIMEYDPSTKMIKNIDTGEFQEFDWSLIS